MTTTTRSGRILRAAALGAAALVAIASIGVSAQDAKPKIAFLYKMGDNPWYLAESSGAQRAADELGVELTMQDLQLDANLALTALDTVIAAGAQGVAIVVPDQAIGPAVLEKAAAAGIPLLAVDDILKNADGSAGAPYLGIDNFAIGEQVGSAAADQYIAGGWKNGDGNVIKIASIELQTLDVCMQRTDGAFAAFSEKVTDLTADDVVHVPYDGTLANGIDAFAATLTANPDVTHWVLWSCNDDGVLGAVRALEAAGVPADKALGIGLGAHLACDEWAKAEPTSFTGAIFLDASLAGYKAVTLLHDAIVNGTPLPESAIYEGVLATRDTGAEVVGCM